MSKLKYELETVGLLPLTQERTVAFKGDGLQSAELFSEQSHHGQWKPNVGLLMWISLLVAFRTGDRR
jgi:hypothetical protein